MRRFVLFLVLAVAFSALYSVLVGTILDALSGALPGAASLFEELLHYRWMAGVALGILTAGLMV